jgi:branched-chain amino acid transport system substrate-binding protein
MMKAIRMMVFFAALCAMPGAASAGAVRVGLMCPLTGGWASEGQDMRQIVSLLADEVNKAGGVNGSLIELVVEDDGGDPRTASLAAQKLATAGVVAVIGTYGSAVTEASQNILDEAEILQIGTGSTSVRLTEKNLPYFFRTCPRDDEQGMVAAQFIQELGYRNIAILHDNSSYARGLADETRALLDKAGLKTVFFDALTPKERDYSAILTKLRAASPDLVFFTGYYPEAGLLLRQKREMGWNVPMMGGDAVNNPDLVKIAGTSAAAGFLFISPPVPADLSTSQGKAFLDAYREKYRMMPQSGWAVLAGDAFNVLVEALRHAEADPAALAGYLKTGLRDYSGITGTFSFDAKGDRVGELYQLYEVDPAGEFKARP